MDGIIIPHNFETQNAEFEFVVHSNKGGGTAIMEKNFELFLLENPMTKDTVIYRKFERNPFKFWNWRFYMASELYDYELKSQPD